ncbi:MAG: 2-oxoacid:acceptor oxidoreductase subunit alpha [Clostridia bacterium]|nr:2-oxoacid:acceptor oxidoreductase subunit alpha [Clostridia bacterium]
MKERPTKAGPGSFSVLVGGKAGAGIDRSGTILGKLLNRMGYRVFIYRDYPSIIRGGHTFSIIRAEQDRIAAHRDEVDIILALDRETFLLHQHRLKKEGICLCDAREKTAFPDPRVAGIPLAEILREEKAPAVMTNTCMIGAFAKAAGIDFALLETVLRQELRKEPELNLKVAKRGYDAAEEVLTIRPLTREVLPLVAGNEAIALGLVKGGVDAYLSYPMTPTTPILHYLAGVSREFSLDILHLENEISVILTALGYAYAGKKAAVGTSGGGFCLMTEGLSLAGMAELPVLIVLGQRTGPSTGLPTYSGQSDLLFALHAGQGEFPRFLVAPGDAEEAYYWSALGLRISWAFQIPTIVLSDKNLGESLYNFDRGLVGDPEAPDLLLPEENPDPGASAGQDPPYRRYALTGTGVSPLAFPPLPGSVIKVNSYEHDEAGITTEDPPLTAVMQEKRLRKAEYLARALEAVKTVNTYEGGDDGAQGSRTALLCWGSNKGPCFEVGRRLGLKVIQPVVLNPFPVRQFQEALTGVEKLITVENNVTAQLGQLIQRYGFEANGQILKTDGRAFSIEELEERVKGAMA